MPLWDVLRRQKLINDIKAAIQNPVLAGPIIGVKALIHDQQRILSPQNHNVIVGTCHEANDEDINEAF